MTNGQAWAVVVLLGALVATIPWGLASTRHYVGARLEAFGARLEACEARLTAWFDALECDVQAIARHVFGTGA
jgi:hypothetical protein